MDNLTCILDQNLIVNSPHHITKRSSGFDKFVKGFGPGASIGGTIGSIFGSTGTVIGAAIGGVGGILCVVFCKGTWRKIVLIVSRTEICVIY